MKSRYQKQTRIATSLLLGFNHSHERGAWHFSLQGALFLAFTIFLLCPAPGLAQNRTQASLPLLYQFESPNLTDVSLLTHAVNFAVQAAQLPSQDSESINRNTLAANQVYLSVEALYRIKNERKDEQTVRLTLSPLSSRENSLGNAKPQNLTLLLNEQPISLLSANETTFYIDLTFQPEDQHELRLIYQVPIGHSKVITIYYPLAWLALWRDNVSIRVNIAPDSQIPVQSWILTEPEGWSYALSSNVSQPDLKWLYDGILPETPILFQFIHPVVWRTQQQLQEAIRITPSAARYLSLGQLYEGLYLDLSSPSTVLDEALLINNKTTAELFYQQSIAAYTKGIQAAEQTGADAASQGRLRAELAKLYRNKIVSDHKVDIHYAELTVQEAAKALALFSSENTQWAELHQWQVEGLYILLQSAREEQDWSRSLSILDELNQIGSQARNQPENPLLAPERLDEIRRNITAQKSLDLLVAGNQQSAMALGGSQIQDAEVQPSIEEQSLFSSWHMTLTVNVQQMTLAIRTITPLLQQETAREQWGKVLQSWQVNEWVDSDQAYREALGSDGLVFETFMVIPSDAERASLMATVPDNPNWAYLREVFKQAEPDIERLDEMLSQSSVLGMELDFRPVGDLWNVMAARLQRQSIQNAVNEGIDSGTNGTNANMELTTRLRSITYANHAKRWQELAQRSWLIVEMEATAAGRSVERTWVTTTNTPSQLLEIKASSFVPLRITILFVLLIGLLTIVSGFLWWLL
ncbi:MAG: hypothetical protein AAF702_01360 [Chloroflexota bacterium]